MSGLKQDYLIHHRIRPALSADAEGRLPERLPSIFADALALTRALNYRYLWIDRLCLQVGPAERRKQIDVTKEIILPAVLDADHRS